MELALQLGWFGYGVWALIVDLKWGSWFFGGANGGCPVVPNAEEDWGFGQILPLCLLFLPVFAALQSYGDDLVCVASSFFSMATLDIRTQTAPPENARIEDAEKTTPIPKLNWVARSSSGLGLNFETPISNH